MIVSEILFAIGTLFIFAGLVKSNDEKWKEVNTLLQERAEELNERCERLVDEKYELHCALLKVEQELKKNMEGVIEGV